MSPNNEQIKEEEKLEVVTDNEEEDSHDPDTVSPKSDTLAPQDESAQNTHDNVIDNNSDKENESGEEEESENESACNPIQNGAGQKEDDSYDSSDDENECDPNNGGKGDKGASDEHSTGQQQDDLCPQISR